MLRGGARCAPCASLLPTSLVCICKACHQFCLCSCKWFLMPCSQIVDALPGIIYIGRMGIGEALICTQDNSTSGGSYTSAISLLGLDSEGREDEECGRVSACSAQTICEHADEAHTFDLPASTWHGILQFSDAACTHSRRTRISGTATGMWQTSCLSPSMTYTVSTSVILRG